MLKKEGENRAEVVVWGRGEGRDDLVLYYGSDSRQVVIQKCHYKILILVMREKNRQEKNVQN